MTADAVELRRVEHHMSTAISLAGTGFDEAAAAGFFGRIAELEGLLSRFRPDSEISRIARGELEVGDADPTVQQVLLRCDILRNATGGDFEHEPRAATGDAAAPVLDPNAVAKGWIVDDAATPMRRSGAALVVNAGGDVLTTPRPDGRPWRVGVQHPTDRHGILGTFELVQGAVATSGSYERGEHVRRRPGSLVSVTVVEERYGLLTLSDDDRLRWTAPMRDDGVVWAFPTA
jgi:thiamine biosynthesis lipoprotein